MTDSRQIVKLNSDNLLSEIFNIKKNKNVEYKS